jgi:acylphosphatase
MRRAHVRVTGRVQGVGFRYATSRRAASLGVAGWVRNCTDGTVEAVFEGDAAAVESLLSWCWRGPRGAEIDAVEVSWEQPSGDGGPFAVR